MTSSIHNELEKYNREVFTRTPTPLDFLEHLSDRLGPEIYLKRDDLTDLALGGDKPRKLEYELAVAREEGATILVTCGSAQSNHARLTAAAARKMGLQVEVVLSRDKYLDFQGNLLTVYLMGAKVHLVDTEDHWDLEEHASKLCDSLRSRGEKPYYVPVSGTTPRSCLGYVRAGLEMADQIEASSLDLNAIYTPFGTGGIFTAMMMALRDRGITCPIIGISVNRNLALCRENFEKWWGSLGELLPGSRDLRPEPFEIYDEFVGQTYGDPTEACLDAIMLMGETEGILLDPVYSGKMFSGFCAHLAAGRWGKGDRIMLVHSGGVPALFAYHKEIRAHLVKRGRSLDL